MGVRQQNIHSTKGLHKIFSEVKTTRSSTAAKSTARPSCLVGVLYDIYQETNNKSTTTWTKLAMKPTEFQEITQNNNQYAVPFHSKSWILVPIESPYASSY